VSRSLRPNDIRSISRRLWSYVRPVKIRLTVGYGGTTSTTKIFTMYRGKVQ
jgi:hypothetical protein